MLGPVHGVPAGAARHSPANITAYPPRLKDSPVSVVSGRPMARSDQIDVEQVLLVGAPHRVVLIALLVADHRAPVVLVAHLPETRVAREHREVAAAHDMRLDGIALRLDQYSS